MKHLFIIISFSLFGFSFSFGQNTPPIIQWQKCLGGTGFERAYSMQKTNDGGYIVAGSSNWNNGDVLGNNGLGDCWVVKLDSSGNIQWQKCLGGSNAEEAYSIQQTNDGGYIVAGDTKSNDGDVSGNHGQADYWVVKIDSIGNIQWQKCLGGSGMDVAYSIQQTNDGGYIVAGNTYSNDGDVTNNHDTTSQYPDYWVVKLDSVGNLQWQKCLGGTSRDEAYSIQQTTDGGYIVAGATQSNDGDVTGYHGTSWNDCWIVKLDSIGNIQWQKCLGGAGDDIVYSIEQITDGNYIVVGKTKSNNGDVTGIHSPYAQDYWVVKLDTIGNILWQKCYGGTLGEEANSIQQTTDGGYILAGWSNSNDGDVINNPYNNQIYWVVKIDSIGNLQWQKPLGGTNGRSMAQSIIQANDGGYVVAGYTSASNGDVSGNHGVYDFWVVKLGQFPFSIEEEKLEEEVVVYPNPAQNTINITNAEKGDIHIYNVLGEEVLSTKCNAGNVTVNVSSLAVGTYILKIVSAKGVVVRKLVIEK